MGTSAQAKGHSTTCQNPTEPPLALLVRRTMDTVHRQLAVMIGKMDKLLPRAALATSGAPLITYNQQHGVLTPIRLVKCSISTSFQFPQLLPIATAAWRCGPRPMQPPIQRLCWHLCT